MHILPTYPYWSSDWDASTSPRHLVQVVAVVVPKRLEIFLPLEEIRRRIETRDGAILDTRGTSSGGQAENTETWEETKEKFLNITSDELWRLQKILMRPMRTSTTSARRRCRLWILWRRVRRLQEGQREPERGELAESRAAMEDFNEGFDARRSRIGLLRKL